MQDDINTRGASIKLEEAPNEKSPSAPQIQLLDAKERERGGRGEEKGMVMTDLGFQYVVQVRSKIVHERPSIAQLFFSFIATFTSFSTEESASASSEVEPPSASASPST